MALDAAWQETLVDFDIAPGAADETDLAWTVVDHPAEHDWRVVDAAMARLICSLCQSPLTTEPTACERCALFHGMRFGAREIDRPGVPPGNEHAIRVASAVARTRARYSPRARVGYELLLPDLLAGALPSIVEAQRAKALINKLSPEECDSVHDQHEVARLARRRS
jgi:hypothetical protein